MFREEATSTLAGFHAGPLYSGQIEIWRVGFCRGRKTGETEEKPLEQGQQQQTQPTYVALGRNRTGATLVGGECSQHHPSLLPNQIAGKPDECNLFMN